MKDKDIVTDPLTLSMRMRRRNHGLSRKVSLEELGTYFLGLSFFLFALPLHPRWILLSLGAGVALLYAYRPSGLIDKPIASLLALFAVSSLASALLGLAPLRAVTVTLTLVPALLAFYVVASRFSMTNLDNLVRVLTVTAATLAVFFMTVAVMNPAAPASDWMNRAGYPHFSVPNDLVFLAVISPFIVHLFLFSRTSAWRVTGFVGLILALACLVLYQSRGGLFLLTVALTLMAPREKLRLVIKLAIAAVFVFFIVDAFNGFRASQKILSISTLSTRLPLWQAAWSLFLESPWFGSGPGAFSIAYERLVAIRELPQWITFDDRHMPWPHNLYLELLAERGIVGLTIMFGVVVMTMRLLINMQRQVTDAKTRNLVKAVRTTLLTILVGGIFELSMQRLWVAIVLFLMVAVVIVLFREQQNEKA